MCHLSKHNALVNWNPHSPGPGTDRGIWDLSPWPGRYDVFCFFICPHLGKSGRFDCGRKRLVPKFVAKPTRATNVFVLRAFYEAECNHPICQRGQPTDKLVWYTAGPSVQYWQTQCSVNALIYQSQIQSDLGDVRNAKMYCNGFCTGHFMCLEKVLATDSSDLPQLILTLLVALSRKTLRKLKESWDLNSKDVE